MAGLIEFQQLPPDQLLANPWNPNVMAPEMFAKELNSIKEFGFVDPITVRKTKMRQYEIIDGEHRWKAATQLQLPLVPCIVVMGLSDQQAKKLTPVLNGLRGEADPERLSELLKDLLETETMEQLLGTMPFDLTQMNDLAGIDAFDWSKFDASVASPKDPSSTKEPWVERTYRMPKSAADVIDQALARLRSYEDGVTDWKALELICADYLA